MSDRFDPRTRSLLLAHGWSAKAHRDVLTYARAWKGEGYVVTPHARQFAANFAGLRVWHAAYRAAEARDWSAFDPLDAISKLDSRWVREEYEVITNTTLCPIGVVFSGHMTYLISACGEIFGGYDGYLCLIGRTVEEGLENIFSIINSKR